MDKRKTKAKEVASILPSLLQKRVEIEYRYYNVTAVLTGVTTDGISIRDAFITHSGAKMQHQFLSLCFISSIKAAECSTKS